MRTFLPSKNGGCVILMIVVVVSSKKLYSAMLKIHNDTNSSYSCMSKLH